MDTTEVIAQAGLVTRSIDTIDRDGTPAKLLSASRTYPTSAEDLWDAVTNPERLPRWFAPVSGDLVVGGRFQVEGNASGTIVECEPPARFEITWEFGGDTSWVTVEIAGDPDGDEARLDLRHVAHVPDELWDQYGPGAVGVGWDLGLLGLALHLSSGESVHPSEVQGWETSSEGRAFIEQASDSWADASIAAGTDESAARASGERVTAFYSPPPGE